MNKHFYISDNIAYLFDENGNYLINNFLNVCFRYNLSNEIYKWKWIGIELGYLININGDFFTSPTFRASWMFDLSWSIKLFPEVYFSDGFNKIYPGLRIGVNLIKE